MGICRAIRCKLDKHTLIPSCMSLNALDPCSEEIFYKDWGRGFYPPNVRQTGDWCPLRQRAQDDHVNGSGQTSPNRASQPSWSHSLGPGTGGVSYIGSVGSVTPGRRTCLVSLLVTNLKEIKTYMMETSITICKIDSQREFAVWLRNSNSGSVSTLEGCDGEGDGKEA